jgi:hypothetical protein
LVNFINPLTVAAEIGLRNRLSQATELRGLFLPPMNQRQGTRISGIGVNVDAVFCTRNFPIPNEPLIIGEQCTFACDQFFQTFSPKAGMVRAMPSRVG